MKKLYTGSYGACKQYPEDLVQVQISRGAPGFWTAKHKAMCWALAPNDQVWSVVRDGTDEWRRRYRLQLEGLLECGKLAETIAGLPDGAILCCWESAENVSSCHRGELAEFLTAHGLAEIGEYPLGDEQLRLPVRAEVKKVGTPYDRYLNSRKETRRTNAATA